MWLSPELLIAASEEEQSVVLVPGECQCQLLRKVPHSTLLYIILLIFFPLKLPKESAEIQSLASPDRV